MKNALIFLSTHTQTSLERHMNNEFISLTHTIDTKHHLADNMNNAFIFPCLIHRQKYHPDGKMKNALVSPFYAVTLHKYITLRTTQTMWLIPFRNKTHVTPPSIGLKDCYLIIDLETSYIRSHG